MGGMETGYCLNLARSSFTTENVNLKGNVMGKYTLNKMTQYCNFSMKPAKREREKNH